MRPVLRPSPQRVVWQRLPVRFLAPHS